MISVGQTKVLECHTFNSNSMTYFSQLTNPMDRRVEQDIYL